MPVATGSTCCLTETGVNTGEFVGYIQTALGDQQTSSCVLGVVKDEMVETTYIDAFDEADSVVAQILVDPLWQGVQCPARESRLMGSPSR